MKTEVKFGDWLEKGFNLYKENFGVLVLSSLIAILLGVISFGILMGPMMAGLCFILLRLVDNQTPKPEVGELFKGFNYFLQAFLFFLVWGAIIFGASFILMFIPCIGQLAQIVLAYGLQPLLMFSMFLIVDRKMEFWPASMESINIVKTNFWPFLGFQLVCAIISQLGAIACGIGVIFTLPIGLCATAIAYREVMASRSAPAEAPAQAQ